jgi:hypothetical protein
MRNNIMLKFSLIIFITIFFQTNAISQTVPSPLLIVPDKDTYSDFLMAPWKEDAPTLIAFKDPLCGYCIKALKQRERLKNYNVFLFWAPILTERSKVKVDAFFTCEKPVSDDILDAVVLRKNVACKGKAKTNLRVLNDKMLVRYKPNFVPQYWFGGQRQTFSGLKLSKSTLDIIKQIKLLSSVKIPWQRYSDLALSHEGASNKTNIALILPTQMTLSEEDMATLKNDKRLNWYLLSENTKSNQRDIEFRMLNDINNVKQPLYILEGKPLSAAEKKIVIPRQLTSLLAASSS